MTNLEIPNYLDAIVADRAMGASRGTVELAGVAPLHSDSDSSDFHVFVQRRAKVVLWNFCGLLTMGDKEWEERRINVSDR